MCFGDDRLQVISGSLAFFIFKQQTDASAFVEDMSYGGARYVGTGREFALMHNPFVTLYVRYARTHLYFAAKLILLCIMLALLDIPGYGPATFGSWMVAISLVVAPFWFNPMQFVMSVTKSDYKQWTRWIDGEEVDPDSKLTWYTWHDKMMSKIRNENANMTDHWLNGATAIISNLFTNGILGVAAISQIKTDEGVGAFEGTDNEIGRKFFLWGVVTLTIVLVVALSYLLQSCYQHRGQAKASRVFRVLPFIFFIIATLSLSEAPEFLKTKDGKNGFRNLLLIYYANLQFMAFIIEVMQRTNQDRASIRHAVDQVYHLLDYFIGVILFGFLFLLSFTGIMQVIQNTLLFNVSFARSIHTKELADAIGFDRDQEKDDDSRGRKNGTSLGDTLRRLTSHDPDANASVGTPRSGTTLEGTFTRTRGRSSALRKMEAAVSIDSVHSFTGDNVVDDSKKEKGLDIISLGSFPGASVIESARGSIRGVSAKQGQQQSQEDSTPVTAEERSEAVN